MAWRSYAAAFVLAAMVANPTAAGPYEDGLRAFARSEYSAALEFLRPLAHAGNSKAQHYVGLIYEGGFGVRRNYVVAAAWYRLAAHQGYAPAQRNLAILYYHNRGKSPVHAPTPPEKPWRPEDIAEEPKRPKTSDGLRSPGSGNDRATSDNSIPLRQVDDPARRTTVIWRQPKECEFFDGPGQPLCATLVVP